VPGGAHRARRGFRDPGVLGKRRATRRGQRPHRRARAGRPAHVCRQGPWARVREAADA
jgi:hypothetical protein